MFATSALLRVFFLALPALFTPGVHAHRHVTSAPQHACHIAGSQLVRCGGDAALGRTAFAPLASHGVSAGVNFTCALRVNGSMTCWGALPGLTRGDFDAFYWTAPDAFLDISAGDAHVCGLRYDGTLRCYGDNSAGQAAPPGGDSVRYTTVSCGAQYTCGVTRGDYTVRCFGAAAAPVVPSQLSRPAPSLTDAVVHVSSGARHACALRANGSVTCFGSDRVPSPPASVAMDWIAAGDGFSCGITRDVGSVVCVGDAPTGLPVTSGWQELSCSTGYCCGVLQGSLPLVPEVGCFGILSPMHFAATTSLVPFPLGDVLKIRSMFLGRVSPSATVCALGISGEIRCRSMDQSLDIAARLQALYNLGPFADMHADVGYALRVCARTVNNSVYCLKEDGSMVIAPLTLTSYEDQFRVSDAYGGSIFCTMRKRGPISCVSNATSDPRMSVPSISATSIAIASRCQCAILVNASVLCWGATDNAGVNGARLFAQDRFVQLVLRVDFIYGLTDSGIVRALTLSTVSTDGDAYPSCLTCDALSATPVSQLWSEQSSTLCIQRNVSYSDVDCSIGSIRSVVRTRGIVQANQETAAPAAPNTANNLLLQRRVDEPRALDVFFSATSAFRTDWTGRADALFTNNVAFTPPTLRPRQHVAGADYTCAYSAGEPGAMNYVNCVTRWDHFHIRGARRAAAASSIVCVHHQDSSMSCRRILRDAFVAHPAPTASASDVAATWTHVCWTASDASGVWCAPQMDLARASLLSATAWSSLSAGYAHICGVASDASIVCGGNNDFGQLQVPPLLQRVAARAPAIAAGAFHTCALPAGGSTIACWGAMTMTADANASVGERWEQIVSACTVTCAVSSTSTPRQHRTRCWDARGLVHDSMCNGTTLHLSLRSAECFDVAAALMYADGTTACSWTMIPSAAPSRLAVSTCHIARTRAAVDEAVSAPTLRAVASCRDGEARIGQSALPDGILITAHLSGLGPSIQSLDFTGAALRFIAPNAFNVPCAAAVQHMMLPMTSQRLNVTIESFAGLSSVMSVNTGQRHSGIGNFSRTGLCMVANTPVCSFTLDTLSALSGIREVSLDNNALQQLQGMTRDWPGLQALSISHQRTALQIAPDALRGVHNLTRLDIVGARAHTTSTGTLSLSFLLYLNQLRHADLRNNDVATLHVLLNNKTLANVHTLQVCGGNPGAGTVFQFPDVFAVFPAVTCFSHPCSASSCSLALAACGVAAIHPSAFTASAFTVSTGSGDNTTGSSICRMDLHGNALRNFVSAAAAVRNWMQAAISASPTAEIEVSVRRNHITELRAPELDGWTDMTRLDLSGNNVTVLDSAAVPPGMFHALKQVNVTDNPIATKSCAAGWRAETLTFASGAQLLACSPCAPGFFCTDGVATPCPAGTFSDATSASSIATCSPCPAGSFALSPGGTFSACTRCAPGRASAAVGATGPTACDACSPGTYSDAPGSVVCEACPAGRYSTTAATTSRSCVDCPIGTYSDITGAATVTQCLTCPFGTTTVTNGSSSIAACEPPNCDGGFELGTGGACSPCPAGRYSPGGFTPCTPCSTGTYASASASSRCDRCPDGTYGAETGATSISTCARCPLGTTCRQDASACDALCPAGTLTQLTSILLPSARNACGTRLSDANQAAACVPCNASLDALCLQGYAETLVSFKRLTAGTAAIRLPSRTSAFTGLEPTQYLLQAATPAPCANFLIATSVTAADEQYNRARSAIMLSATVFGASLVAIVLVCMLPRDMGSVPRRIVRSIDGFSLAHVTPAFEQVRNIPTGYGGIVSISAAVALAAITVALIMQCLTANISGTATLADARSLPVSAQSLQDIRVYAVLTGPADPATACASISSAAVLGERAWFVEYASTLPLSESTATSAFDPTVSRMYRESAMLSCSVTLACIQCASKAAIPTLSIALPFVFQSILVSPRVDTVRPSCGTAPTLVYLAQDAAHPVQHTRLALQLDPVSFFDETGGLITSQEIRLGSSDISFLTPTDGLRPLHDTVRMDVSFETSTAATRVQFSRKLDFAQIVFAIVSAASAVIASAKFFMRLTERIWTRLQTVRGMVQAYTPWLSTPWYKRRRSTGDVSAQSNEVPTIAGAQSLPPGVSDWASRSPLGVSRARRASVILKRNDVSTPSIQLAPTLAPGMLLKLPVARKDEPPSPGASDPDMMRRRDRDGRLGVGARRPYGNILQATPAPLAVDDKITHMSESVQPSYAPAAEAQAAASCVSLNLKERVLPPARIEGFQDDERVLLSPIQVPRMRRGGVARVVVPATHAASSQACTDPSTSAARTGVTRRVNAWSREVSLDDPTAPVLVQGESPLHVLPVGTSESSSVSTDSVSTDNVVHVNPFLRVDSDNPKPL